MMINDFRFFLFFLFFIFVNCSDIEPEYHGQIERYGKIVALHYIDYNKYGLKDTLGNIILDAQFDYIEKFHEFGVIKVDSGGTAINGGDYIDYKWNKIGLINTIGKILIRPYYDEINFSANGIALVKSKGEFGYIDKSGNPIIEIKFDFASIFKNKFAVVKKSNEFFIIDVNEKVIYPKTIDSLFLGWYGKTRDTLFLGIENNENKLLLNDGRIITNP